MMSLNSCRQLPPLLSCIAPCTSQSILSVSFPPLLQKPKPIFLWLLPMMRPPSFLSPSIFVIYRSSHRCFWLGLPEQLTLPWLFPPLVPSSPTLEPLFLFLQDFPLALVLQPSFPRPLSVVMLGALLLMQ